MEELTLMGTLQLLCRSTNKYGMFLSINYSSKDEFDTIFEAVPYLKDVNLNIIVDGYGFFLFDTEKEMNHYYTKTVGNGIFAIACDECGNLIYKD